MGKRTLVNTAVRGAAERAWIRNMPYLCHSSGDSVGTKVTNLPVANEHHKKVLKAAQTSTARLQNRAHIAGRSRSQWWPGFGKTSPGCTPASPHHRLVTRMFVPAENLHPGSCAQGPCRMSREAFSERAPETHPRPIGSLKSDGDEQGCVR